MWTYTSPVDVLHKTLLVMIEGFQEGMAYRKNKIVFLGDEGVGKSNIFTRLKSDCFAGNASLPREDECKKIVRVDGKEVPVRCR